MKSEIVKTADGSYTLFVPELNEHYHSVHGAMQESGHVFIKCGFVNVVKRKHNVIKVLEVGFGTGLNALLTAIEADKLEKHVEFTAIEAHPLKYGALPPLKEGFSEADIDLYKQMHKVSWENMHTLSEYFSIKKHQHALENLELTESYHVIYHDAFAPDVQPNLWTEEVFKKLYRHTIPGGVLVTYSAKGAVKRALKSAGYSIEPLPGPPGKREITRAMRAE